MMFGRPTQAGAAAPRVEQFRPERLGTSTDAREQTNASSEWIAYVLSRAVWLVPAVSLAGIVAIFIPRFGIDSPSLIDDWFALTYAPTAAHQLVHGHYDTAVVDYGGRYRPTYMLLSYVQWTFGSRSSTLVPSLIGLARLLFFAGAVAAVVVAVLRGIASRTWLVIAASIAPTIVIATRGVSYNFVRFGIGEPTSLAAVAIGLVGMTVAVRTVVRTHDGANARRSVITFALGYAAYVFGAYMSEASAAVVLLLPALYYWISREPGFVGNRASRTVFAISAALIVLPVAHILWEVGPGASGNKAGGHTTKSLISDLVGPAGSTVVGVLKTEDLTWPILIVLTLVISVRRAIRRDRHAVLFAGMLVSGVGAAYLASLGTSGNHLSRYYIPLLAATAIAFMWLLQSIAPKARAIILASVMLVVLAGRGDLAARTWLDMDRAGDTAIVFASEAHATRCPVYLTDFPAERRMGLARVLDHAPDTLGSCGNSGRRVYVVRWLTSAAVDSPAYPRGCETGWQAISRRDSVELDRCDAFGRPPAVPKQDVLSEAPRVVRFVPPSNWIDASALNRLAYVRH